ncbi:MAG TPA: methyltransferase domain-containing protein [Thermoanaerobaculia bacterium]|nr:methyltransferase domain-containing protein [Thermoanaerobaculia bacterium]
MSTQLDSRATDIRVSERDYVLGTHDEELERLGLQHRVWRPRALDAWRRAGFTAGQTLLDVGCGPGYGTLDLAGIAGPSGQVIACDRSRRFLDALEARAKQHGADRITTVEIDLDEGELPPISAHGAWVRWVFAFLKNPRALVAKLHDALKPGGVLVTHEYFDYSTWRLAPRLPEFEEFVAAVMESWRANGGEPDVGLDLPRWLEEEGFAIRDIRTIVDVVTPANYVWQWPKAFFETGLDRLVQLGHFDAARADRARDLFAKAEAAPHVRMVTPAVVEIIAVRE